MKAGDRAVQREFRNTRIDEAITEVVAATTAPAAVAASTENSVLVIRI